MLAWVKDETYPRIHLMDGETRLLSIRPWEEGDDKPVHSLFIDGQRSTFPNSRTIDELKESALIYLLEIYRYRMEEIKRALPSK